MRPRLLVSTPRPRRFVTSHESISEVDYESVRTLRGTCLQASKSVAQADIYELEWEGRPAVMKDFSGRPWLVRVLVARWIAAREVRMLRRLVGMEGVPRLLAVAGPEALVMERIDGTRVPRRRRGGRPPVEFWDRARRLIEQLHEQGIAHGDLRFKNVLIGPGGQPYLIDFATAMRRRPGRAGAWLADFFFQRCRRVDQFNFARMKAKFEPEGLDEDERRWLGETPLYLKIGRFLKKRVYRLKKPSFWRKLVPKSRRRRRRTKPDKPARHHRN